MAQFKSYANPRGFNPIQVPDETQKYLNQGNNFIKSLANAAQFDIAEKNRQLQAVTNNNDLENANRDFIFQRSMENKQRVQQAILGNYDRAAQNAETQGLNQARLYSQLSAFSKSATEAGVAVYQQVQVAKQERYDKAVREAGDSALPIMKEYATLGKNVTDEVINTNPYFQGLIKDNGITTSQIRYLGENYQSGRFVKSRAAAELIGQSSDAFISGNSDKKFDINGTQISLNEAEAQGNQGAVRQILSTLGTQFYRENRISEFPTETQQQYINPYTRAAENQITQRTAAKYRQNKSSELANETFLAHEQQWKDAGPLGGQIAADRITAATGDQRNIAISQELEYQSNKINLARVTGDGNPSAAIANFQQFLAATTVKGGVEMTMGEALAGRPEITQLGATIQEARDGYQRKLVQDAQRTQQDAFILESKMLAEASPQTADEVDQLYAELRKIHPGYTSDRLEAIKRNETTEAKALVESNKTFEKLATAGLLVPDDFDRLGATLSQRQTFGGFAKANLEARQLNGNYKTQMEAIDNAVKGIPGVVKGPNSVVHWTVGIKIGQLQNQFYSRLQSLRTAGDTDPMLATKVAASVIQDFQRSPNVVVSGKVGDFGGFRDILSIGGPNGAASARNRHVFSGLEAAGRDGTTNTFLDRDGAVYTVSELKKIVVDSKKPGWKPDQMAFDIGSRLGVSPLTVINRQLAARKDPSLPLITVPEPLKNYVTGVRPEFMKALERLSAPPPQLSVRAMGSTNVFLPETIKPYNGINIGGLIQQAATKYNLPPAVLAGLLSHESAGFAPDVLSGQRNSSAGAIGIAQFMPATAAGMGVNPLNIPQAIDGSARYLNNLMRHPNNPGNSLNWAIQAYNSGPNGVGLSQENREYFSKVMKEAYKFGHGQQALQHSSLMRSSMTRYGQATFERPSSVVFEQPGKKNQPGVDLYFESKRFPALLGGVVKDVSREPRYGNYIVIESIDPMNGQKVDVLYGHLADGITLRPGQQIDAGDIIGTQGGTGNVRSADGTIASIDFLAPAPRGSKSMVPHPNFDRLRRYLVQQLQR